MDKARISTATASLAALAILIAAAAGCAVVSPNGQELSRNGRAWSAAGRYTDRLGGTTPVNLPDARPAPLYIEE